MKYDKAVYALFFVFLAAIALQIVVLFIALLKNYFDTSDLKDFLISVLKIYSVHLSMLFAGTFFNRLSATQADVDKRVFTAAFSLSLLWNLVLAGGLIIQIFFAKPLVNVIIQFQEDIASNSAFLITGVLSYFFLTKSSNA